MNSWIDNPVHPINHDTEQMALARQDQLTKPQGALGQLERLAVRLSALQGRLDPQVDRVAVRVYAGDHGVCEEGVSAFPQVVTAEMIRNFGRGGAAISVLARQLNADFAVLNLGTVEPLETISGVEDHRVMAGTANFVNQPAMSAEALSKALQVGADSVDRLHAAGCDLFIAGEMGIGNTTAATALACAFLDLDAERLAGPGTGLPAEGVQRKAAVIAKALAHHQPHNKAPIDVLAALGGLEIAAMVGAYIRCAQRGLPALVDGFITTAAAMVAVRLNPNVRDWLLFGHQSAEPGHRMMLEALHAEPILKLDMRLGEGSGAAAAVPVLRAACVLQNEMATFAEAAVSSAE